MTCPFDFDAAQKCAMIPASSVFAETTIISRPNSPETMVHRPCEERLAIPAEISGLQEAWNVCPPDGAIN